MVWLIPLLLYAECLPFFSGELRLFVFVTRISLNKTAVFVCQKRFKKLGGNMQKNVVKNVVNKTGFTLIELLVGVLIIGILSAIALPGYRKAVERSRVSDALTTMQAVAKSEHGWYLTNNSYTNDFANLDIEINGTINEGALETDFYTYELLDTGILAERNNHEYLIYKDYETNQIMCTPGSHYICEELGAFTKVPCEKLEMAWANTNSTCYINEEERCLDLHADKYGTNIWKGTYCGYTGTSSTTLDEGMVCNVNRNIGQCDYPTINNGGKCIASGGCTGAIINAGGVCQGGYYGGCNGSTVNAGGKCNAGANGSCQNIIVTGGTCESGGLYGCNFSTFTAGSTCISHQSKTCSGDYYASTCIGDGRKTCGGYTEQEILTFHDKSTCVGNYDSACTQARTIFEDGSKCVANVSGACSGATYKAGSCCESEDNLCPSTAPKCICPKGDGTYATSC